MAPTYRGLGEGHGEGRRFTFRFSSGTCLVRSSISLALSLLLTTCAHVLICVSVSCLKVTCWDWISSCFFLRSRIYACKASFGVWREEHNVFEGPIMRGHCKGGVTMVTIVLVWLPYLPHYETLTRNWVLLDLYGTRTGHYLALQALTHLHSALLSSALLS